MEPAKEPEGNHHQKGKLTLLNSSQSHILNPIQKEGCLSQASQLILS